MMSLNVMTEQMSHSAFARNTSTCGDALKAMNVSNTDCFVMKIVIVKIAQMRMLSFVNGYQLNLVKDAQMVFLNYKVNCKPVILSF